ncbi:epstein-barr virus ebna-1-like protein [Hordeum vulgare]|nr:epstein-barr virus ebna-1-like protein [Hordeum vulgare]
MYIQLIGLGGLLKTPSIKITRVLCLAFANSYDAERDAFIINGRPCRITLEDVAHITGMPCDGNNHVPSNLYDNMDLWKKQKDSNDTKITFKGLLAKMKGHSTPNFVRPFVLYTIGKYVCRTKEEYVDNKYIGIDRNIETIKGTNIGQLSLDYLMDSVKNFVNGEAILEWNLPLLQTWYYEKFRVLQLDSSISYESRLRSLIQNWSEEKARKVENIIQNNYLGVGEYVEDLMMPFIPARDGTVAKPKTGAQVLVERVLIDLQEVASLVREAGAEQVDRMRTLEKKMDECLGRTHTNGKLTEDLIKELNVVDAAIQLMRHDEPIDTRDDQVVYIERVAGVSKLERDGSLPTNSLNVHWFLVVVNPRRKEIHVLDSLFQCMVPTEVNNVVRGIEAHLRAAMRVNEIESNAWEDIKVTQWLVRIIKFLLCTVHAENIELFMGVKLRMQYDQGYIEKFRRELLVVLVDSPYIKMKYRKRFKQYHAILSDADAVEDDEDASS